MQEEIIVPFKRTANLSLKLFQPHLLFQRYEYVLLYRTWVTNFIMHGHTILSALVDQVVSHTLNFCQIKPLSPAEIHTV